jgi:hypothetical protein
MNYSKHSILDNPYWRQLVVRGNFPYEIPSSTMMEESILQPKLDRDFAVKILNQYEIEDTTEIKKILELNKPDTLWKEITEKLSIKINGEHKYNPKLYTFFSLQNHRLAQTKDHISDRISDSIFRGWSNLVISNMIHAPENQYLKNFCRTKIITPDRDISYEHIRFHMNVLTYCRNVLPRPLCYPQSHTSDHQSMQQFAAKVKEQFTNPDIDIPFRTISAISENTTKDKETKELVRKQQRNLAYPRQIEETDRRLDIRFVERCESRKWLEKIQLEYHIDLSKYTESRLSNHVENIERDEKKRRDKNKNNPLRKRRIQEIADLPGKKDEELHQCQFCYKYRIEKPKYPPKWHCGEEMCKSAYQHWLDDLRENDIKLEDLRLIGF